MGSLIEFPAVVSDGVAFIGNARGHVRAVSMRTGRVALAAPTRATGWPRRPRSSATSVIVHTMSTGHVLVLDRYNGKILHRYTIGSPIESSPVVRDGIDYFGAWNGVVYAFDLRRGRTSWTLHAPATRSPRAPRCTAGRLFIGDYGGRLLALNAANGSLRWSGSVNGRIYGTPAVAGGRVFVPSSSGGSLTAFSVTGRELWSRSTGSYVYSSPAAWGGRVFFGSYNGLLYCLSGSSGATIWTRTRAGGSPARRSIVDGIVYAGTTRADHRRRRAHRPDPLHLRPR